MAAEDKVDQIIDAALDAADSAQLRAESFAETALKLAQQDYPSDAIFPPEVGELTIPDLDEPSVDLGNLFDNESDAKVDEIQAMLDNELGDFLNTYYPCGWIDKVKTLCNKYDDWIKNGGTGLSNAVEQAIWDRAREREGRLNERSTEEAAGVTASLGWSLPPGVTTNRQLRVAQDNINRDSSLSKDVAIEQARLEQSNVRFALSSSITLHQSIMGSAQSFVNAKLRAESIGQQYAQLLWGATQAFYNDSIRYYQAKLTAERLTLDQDIADYRRDLEKVRTSLDIVHKQARVLTDAALASARTMGDIAASARSTTNTMASLSHETTSEES